MAPNETLAFTFLSISGQFRKYFHINEGTGIISLTSSIDREKVCTSAETLDCFVKTSVALRSGISLQIFKVLQHITDINDHSPAFPVQSHHIEISESADPGTSFTIPDAVDKDSGNNGLVGYKL
ncbi:hypothetical protein HELRODRAFT_65629, partial [Helobdella robusta]|uniref:Cadherin domain-containing protein n=1 Tax=Helobdella robusta TaxID=6412 RepID=T1FYA9_HELRO